MALHSKKSKRCPVCRHILIKPEQKAQSTRYKIKLVASNYLPSIHAVVLNAPLGAANILKKSSSARPTEESTRSVLHAGKTYPIRLSFSNPMYDSISIQLSVQRHPLSKSKPGFAVSLPTGGIAVGAYQEAWDFDDDDEQLPDIETPGVEKAPWVSTDRDAKGRVRSIGIVDRKANVTTIAGEVLISKECQGDVKVSGPLPIQRTDVETLTTYEVYYDCLLYLSNG
jgi:dynactin 4